MQLPLFQNVGETGAGRLFAAEAGVRGDSGNGAGPADFEAALRQLLAMVGQESADGAGAVPGLMEGDAPLARLEQLRDPAAAGELAQLFDGLVALREAGADAGLEGALQGLDSVSADADLAQFSALVGGILDRLRQLLHDRSEGTATASDSVADAQTLSADSADSGNPVAVGQVDADAGDRFVLQELIDGITAKVERLPEEGVDTDALKQFVQDLPNYLRDVGAASEGLTRQLSELADDVEQAVAQSDQTIQGLLAMLLPRLQNALRNWSGSGNALPPAAADETAQGQIDSGARQPGWQDIARMLLGARPSGGENPAAQNLVADAAAGPLSIKAGVEQGFAAADKVAFMLSNREALLNGMAAEQDRILQNLTNPEQALSVRSNPIPLPAINPPTVTVTQAAPSPAAGAPQAFPTMLAPIQVPPGDGAWGRALGERLLWMVGRDVQSAEIRLNPRELGPVDIRVVVQNDQASVTLNAQHPFTRDALEAAIPRLREMLGESNLNLVNVDVGQRDTGESGDGRQPDAEPGMPAEPFAADEAGEQLAGRIGLNDPVRTVSGLVDYFA